MRPVASIPAPSRRQRGFGFYFFAGIVILLALQCVLYLELVSNAIGPFTLLRKMKAPDPSLVREMKVALLRSETTAQMFPENPEGYYGAELHWEAILRREGIPFRVISDAGLAPGLEDANVLVLPMTSCLGKPQRKAILGFLAEGKGVVASGPLGTRDGHCASQGWDFLRGLTGIETAATVQSSGPAYATFKGQAYFSEKMPTGYRLEIPSQELTVVTAKEADVFWTDWMLRPAQGSALAESALAVHSINAGGRVVWYGFNPLLPVERRADQTLLDEYLARNVLWAGKQPLAVLGNWPNMHQAAVLVADEVGQDFTNAEENARLLKQQGVPAIFVCASSEAKKNPAAVKSFESAGEVASAGNTPEPFGGELTFEQANRLREAKRELEQLTRRTVLGFSPPQGLADTATVLALNAAGYRYYLNEMAVSRAVPEIIDFTESVFFPFQKSEVAKIFRTSSDDFEIIANYHGPDPPGAELAERFLSDFRRSFELGGVYTLYFHTYLLGAPKDRPVLGAILDEIKAKSAWRTTGQDLVKWWSARNRIQALARKVSVHRIRVDVANTGLADLKDVSVYVYLPYRPKKFHVSSIIFRLQSPQTLMLDHDNVLRLDFPKLSAQTYYTYMVGLDEELN